MDNKPTLINGQYADIDALLIKSGVLKKDGMIYASYMPTAHIQNLREVMEEYANQWKVKYNALKADNESLKEKADKMAEALQDIARQHKSNEWESEGDTEHGYNCIIDVARDALSTHSNREGE